MAYRPLYRDPEQQRRLRDLFDRFRRAPSGGSVVLDLDGCLLDNRGRQLRILREFACQHDCPALYAITPDHVDSWSLREILGNAGIPTPTARELLPRLERFWNQRFYRDAYLVHDEAMPGAPAFVHRVLEADLRVAYLTGRVASCREGTEHTLAAFHLPRPDGERVRLFMRPDDREGEGDWKVRAAEAVRAHGRPEAFLDNIPANLAALAPAFPGALPVLVSTDHPHFEVRSDEPTGKAPAGRTGKALAMEPASPDHPWRLPPGTLVLRSFLC